jgi:two-component system cell cycle response regulator DivK
MNSLKPNCWSQKTILIVEDLPHNYELIEQILLPYGPKVKWARNGLEAIEYCSDAHNKVDVVLMDINLPVVNGYVATKKLKTLRPSLPIITQTAYSYDGEREKSFEAGSDEYLEKPLKASVVLDVLSRWIKD